MMTNMQPSRVRTDVMRRVHIIHTVEPLLTTMVASIVLFVVGLWGIGREVWVARVLHNMPSWSNVGAVAHFYLAAFLDTRFIVQVLIVLVVATFIWLAYSSAKMLTSFTQFA
jgi:hypothetical protein